MTIRFDAVPFAARQEWTSGQTYEVWWDDPRDLFEVITGVRLGIGT